jgi:hypothetical protein
MQGDGHRFQTGQGIGHGQLLKAHIKMMLRKLGSQRKPTLDRNRGSKACTQD